MDAGLAIAVAAFVFNVIGAGVTAVWAVAKIRNDTSEKIQQERIWAQREFADLQNEFKEELANMLETFRHEQRTQDHSFGEVGAAMRQYIASVEKKLNEVEIWGRDNYVLKEDFKDAVDLLRTDLRSLGAEMKSDLRAIAKKLDE